MMFGLIRVKLIFLCNCLFHFWQVALQKFLLSSLYILPLFDLVPLLVGILPLKIIVLLQQSHKKSTSVLVMWHQSHGLVKTNKLGLFNRGREHVGLDLVVVADLLHMLEYFYTFLLLIDLLPVDFYFICHSLNPTHFPLQHPPPTLKSIPIMDINNLKSFSDFAKQGRNNCLVFDRVERTCRIHDKPSSLE